TREGISGDAASFKADISDDGRFVVFISLATNIAGATTVDNGFADVYLRDRDRDENGVFDEPGSAATGTFLLSLGFADDGSPELADFSSDFRPSISGDGSTVVFSSAATNLVDPAIATDPNGIGEDIFVVTTEGLKREVLTLNVDGDATGVGFFGEGEAELFAVSGDGSVIAFQSRFNDIVETTDAPFARQIFVRAEKLDRISDNRDDEGGDMVSRESVISRDGRHVAFITPSANLVAGLSGINNVYVYDLGTGLLTLVSRNFDPLDDIADGNAPSASGGGPDARQYALSISDDGRIVTYSSLATNLVDPALGDTIGTPDIFAFDRDADMDGVFDEVDVPGATETTLVSVNFAGTAAGAAGASAPGAGSVRAAISGNGRYIAFASTAGDLLEEPTSGLNYFVRDLLSEVTYLASPGPGDDPLLGSTTETLGQQSISISRDGSRVAFISDSDLDSDTIDDNSSRDVYVFTLPSFIDMQRFSASGSTNLNLRYEILNTPVDAGFSIDIVRSSDEVFDPESSDIVLATIEISDPDDLSVGVHDLTFRIGGGPGEIPLPGAGAEEPGDEKPIDYFLLATADIEDVDDAPMPVADTAIFSGYYHPPDAPIFVHGTPLNDTITGTTVDGIVNFSFSTEGFPVEQPLFPPDDVTSIRVRAHGGDDTVTGSAFGDLLIGGPGKDVLFGEAGGDTMDGGDGADRVFGGDDFDMLFDSSGDDLVDTGGPDPFGGTVNGVPGSDNIYIGAGEDILTFEDATLGIDFDPRDTEFQVVDVDANRVQATGFTHFIGSAFDDTFSLDGDLLTPLIINGGVGGLDVLNVDAGGLPATNDGRVIQVLGFESIQHSNFARVNVFNSAPLVRATLDDQLFADPNGQVDPGDTLRYVATITNDGVADALGVTFADILDPNTTLVPNSIRVSPFALDDSYRVAPNTTLSVDAVSGLLANDVDVDGDRDDLSVVVGSVTRIGAATGSSVTVQQDGSFVYEPALEFGGSETFTYTIADADGLSSLTEGLITFDVTATIWFVDNTLPSNGDGSLVSPFNSLLPLNGGGGRGDADGPGDTIFVFGGNADYDQQFELEDDQILIGEGAGLIVGDTTVVAPGSRPTLTSSIGDGLVLASNNTVRGVD
ncbi:MAG: cadherin-like domain-containing protein, partial [Pirellulaceae bacterium]|nr:cadherin-like domain-containing protein [Pirellulaceae bacterium]